MMRLLACFSMAAFLAFFTFCPAYAGPILIDNGTAEVLPKGKWVAEYHYGYYQATVIKNTAYWGYEKGNGEMQKMSKYDMKLINQVQTLEVYHALTDRVLIGGVFPYLMQNIAKQRFLNNEKDSSSGFGDSAFRLCVNLWDPQKSFLGASLVGAVGFPMGDENADPPLGSGRYNFTGGVVLTKILSEKMKAHVTLCYTLPTQNGNYRYWGMYSKIRTGNVFHYGTTLEYALTKKFNALCDLSGFMAPASRKSTGATIKHTGYSVVHIAPGLQYKMTKNITLEAAVKVALKQDGDFDFAVAPIAGVVLVF